MEVEAALMVVLDLWRLEVAVEVEEVPVKDYSKTAKVVEAVEELMRIHSILVVEVEVLVAVRLLFCPWEEVAGASLMLADQALARVSVQAWEVLSSGLPADSVQLVPTP